MRPRRPQSIQTMRALHPCNSLSNSHPAFVSRLSTFWVTCQNTCKMDDALVISIVVRTSKSDLLYPQLPSERTFDASRSVGRQRTSANRCSFSPNTFDSVSDWSETLDTSCANERLVRLGRWSLTSVGSSYEHRGQLLLIDNRVCPIPWKYQRP